MTKIIVPVSGGKDSQATLILAMQDGREVIPVFNETGWDHPDTYKHLDYMVGFFGLTLAVTKWDDAPTLPELISKMGRFPFGLGRFCTSRYKQRAFKRWLHKQGGQFEIWLGIRSDESPQRRKKYGEMSVSDLYEMGDLFPGEYPKNIRSRMKYNLPLLNHTREDVFSVIEKAGMVANPLYALGFDRVGCFPCLLAGKPTQELAFSTEFGKAQFKIIEQLEISIGEKYKYQTEDLTCSVCKI